MICCIVALLLSGLVQQGDPQTKWDNVYDMPRFVNYETSGIIVKDMPKLECGKADTFDIREIPADMFVDLSASAEARLMDVFAKSLFSHGDFADYLGETVSIVSRQNTLPQDLSVYRNRVGIDRHVDSYLVKVRYGFIEDRLFLVNVKDDTLKSIMDISKDAKYGDVSFDHRYVKISGSRIELYEKSYVKGFNSDAFRDSPYCHLASVELNAKGCLTIADTYCELFKDYSDYEHGKYDGRELRKRAWNEDFNYRGLRLAVPELPRLKEIHLDSLNVSIQDIKTAGLKELSSATVEVLGREMDYDWRRMHFYYYGRINLNKEVDSYLIYTHGAWNDNGGDYKVVRAMYLVNLKDGIVKSIVPVSRYCYLTDKFETSTAVASCSRFYGHRFELGSDDYGDALDLCVYSDAYEEEFGAIEEEGPKSEDALLKERREEMVDMGRNAAQSHLVEFTLGSDGYVEYKKLIEDNLWFLSL